jgi:hypothetical protein
MTHNLAYKIDGDANECGPGNTWTCAGVGLLGLTLSSPISQTAFYQSETGFKLAWAWDDHNAGGISLLVKTYNNDFSQVNSTGIINLLQFNISPWSGYTTDARPAVAFDSDGNPHVAAVITKIEDNVDHLVYIHPGTESNTSCRSNGSTWICDEIEAGFYGTEVQLSMTTSDTAGISYYDSAMDALMYAYPPSLSIYHPNCGPKTALDDFTWRCIEIDQGPGADKIDQIISMDMGPGNVAQIAYLYDVSADTNRTLKTAKFVSSGGNCGLDYRLTTFPNTELTNRWQCTTITVIDYDSPYIAGLPSLKIDPQGFAVIAYAQDHGGPVSLNLTYPAQRIGGPVGSYSFEEIDLPVDTTLELALNSAGLGLIGYKEKYVSGEFRIAWQQFSLHLPLVRK